MVWTLSFNMLSIKYSHNESTKDEIRGHLEIMSPYFQPPLAGRCSITDYSLKLFTYAQREEAYCNDSLIGLVAYYIDGKTAYVSNVSVLPEYSRKNIGSTLLTKMESFLTKSGISIVSMEIADNELMIAFYRKNGFDLDRQLENGKRRMVKYLNVRTPLVSIICLVYNHANYLRECFDGFIMQRVNFPIEILVHDDASTDNSAEIIKDYTDKYPQLFKPIFQTINQYSKGVHISATYQYPRCRGKYIAVCEGDDYWTDPYKLQRQVDFLEANPEYGLVHSDYACLIESEGKIVHKAAKKKYTINEGDIFLDLFKECSIKTLTICFRAKFCHNMPELPRRAFQGDRALFFEIARQSKIHYDDCETGVYRVLNDSASHITDWQRWKHVIDSYRILDYFYLQYTDSKAIHKQVDRKWFISDLKYYIRTKQYDKISRIAFVPNNKRLDCYYIIWKLRRIRPIMNLISYCLYVRKRYQQTI